MEAAILGVFVVSLIAGFGMIISATIARRRVPEGQRQGVAVGRLTTGIVLLVIPVALTLLGLLVEATIGRLGTV
jgi:putative exporter of polyketide antibiotics